MCLQGVLVDVELNQRMTEVCRNSVRAFVEDRTDKDGRVSIKALNKFAQMTGLGAREPWTDVIKVVSMSRLFRVRVCFRVPPFLASPASLEGIHTPNMHAWCYPRGEIQMFWAEYQQRKMSGLDSAVHILLYS